MTHQLKLAGAAAHSFTWLALIGTLAALAPGAAEASITIDDTSLYARALDGTGGNVSTHFFQAIPPSTTFSATDGANSSDNTINWSTIGGQTILSLDMVHERTGTPGAQGLTNGSIFFTATSDTTYALSGAYGLDDGDGRRVYQNALLRDLTDPTVLFSGIQESRATEGEQFVLGETGGDFNNYLSGSLTGNLLEDHEYELYLSSFIHSHSALLADDGGASAVGNFTLTITENSAVPEPLSLMVWVRPGLGRGVGEVSPRWAQRVKDPVSFHVSNHKHGEKQS